MALFLSSLPHEPLIRSAGGVIPLWSRRLKSGSWYSSQQRVILIKEIKEVTKPWLSGLSNGTIHQEPLSLRLREVDDYCLTIRSSLWLNSSGNAMTVAIEVSVKKKYPQQLLMADISTFEEGLAAVAAGLIFNGTTHQATLPTVLCRSTRLWTGQEALWCGGRCWGQDSHPDQAKQIHDLGVRGIVVKWSYYWPKEITDVSLQQWNKVRVKQWRPKVK